MAIPLPPSDRLDIRSPSNEGAAFFCFSWISRAIRTLLSTSPIFFPNLSSISRRSCSLSSSAIAPTRLSFSSLIRTRQSFVSSPFDGRMSFVPDACCTTGGMASRDDDAAGWCRARFLANTLFDLCCAIGKPDFDPLAWGTEGAGAEGPGFRSKTEPTMDLLCPDIITIVEVGADDDHWHSGMKMAVKDERGDEGCPFPSAYQDSYNRRVWHGHMV
jgi:hypothetical protein